MKGNKNPTEDNPAANDAKNGKDEAKQDESKADQTKNCGGDHTDEIQQSPSNQSAQLVPANPGIDIPEKVNNGENFEEEQTQKVKDPQSSPQTDKQDGVQQAKDGLDLEESKESPSKKSSPNTTQGSTGNNGHEEDEEAKQETNTAGSTDSKQVPQNDEISKLEEDFKQKLQEEGYDTLQDLIDEQEEYALKLKTVKNPKKILELEEKLLKIAVLVKENEEILQKKPEAYKKGGLPDNSDRIKEIIEELDECELTKEGAIELLQNNRDLIKKQKNEMKKASTQKTIDLLTELIGLLDGNDGGGEPEEGKIEPQPPKQKTYEEMNEEEKRTKLDELLKQRRLPQIYKQRILEDKKEEVCEPPKKTKPILKQVNKKEWEDLTMSLFETFISGNTHWAMNIYYQNEGNQQLIIPTMLFDAFNALKNIKPPESLNEDFKGILDDFSTEPIAETIDNIDSQLKSQSDQVFRDAVNQALKELRDHLEKANPKAAQFRQLKSRFPQLKGLTNFDECFEGLIKGKTSEAAGHLRKVLKHCNAENRRHLFTLYSEIAYIEPEYKKEVPLNEFLKKISPDFESLINPLVKEFEKAKLSENYNIGTFNKPSKLLELLYEIFFDDPQFCKELIEFIGFSEGIKALTDACKLQLRNFKDLQIDHLTSAYEQIKNESQQRKTISQFLRIDTDRISYESIKTKVIAPVDSEDKSFKTENLTTFLFEVIKKKRNFTDFINEIKSHHFEFTQQFLLSWLLNNSDQNLRAMLMIVCSCFMPVPLITYQKAQQEDNDDQIIGQQPPLFQPQVFEELFFCFEQKDAVLNFKVSANPQKYPQDCTSFANDVFNRKFETHSSSLVNFGGIDIQFDYNFEDQMYVPVADAHGLVDQDLLNLVYSLFNIFVIHSFTSENDLKVLKREIEKIRLIQSKALIFIIYHDQSMSWKVKIPQSEEEKSAEGNYEIFIKRYTGLDSSDKQNLRKFITQIFLKNVQSEAGNLIAKIGKHYEANYKLRVDSLSKFSAFIETFNDYRSSKFNLKKASLYIKDDLSLIENFMKEIEKNYEELRSQNVLPLNYLFTEASIHDRKMTRGALQKDEEINYADLRKKIKETVEQMKATEYSQLTKKFMEIIDNKLINYLGVSAKISRIIKNYLDSKQDLKLKDEEDKKNKNQKEIQELNEQIKSETDEELKEKLVQQLSDKQNEKQQLAQISKDLRANIQKKWFAIEFIYRELYIKGYSREMGELKETNPYKDYFSLGNLQVQKGQPFELIDGNNFQFIKDVYQQITAEGAESKILVLSIVGRQSTGKSLILNSLFGVQFLSAAARCTRGVYGCLLDIVGNDKYKKILLLDTEGIQSFESTDKSYDKRVVFYALSVSHIVLICEMGNFNQKMIDVIKLAKDCISQVKQFTACHPQVNLIMNSINNNDDSISQQVLNLQKVLEDEKTDDENEGSNVFQITSNNVFVLPNAFSSSDLENCFKANYPSSSFASKVELLKQKIMNFINEIYTDGERKPTSFTLKQWFDFAQSWWDFTDSFKGLTDYSTLEERQEDRRAIEYINTIVKERFDDQEESNKQKIDKIVEEEWKQFSGFDKTNMMESQNKILNELDEKMFKEVTKELEQLFEEFLKQLDYKTQILKKRRDDLLTQIEVKVAEYKSQAINKIGEYFKEQSQFIANTLLTEKINEKLKMAQQQENTVTEEEAGKIFDDEIWKETKEVLMKKLKSIENINKETAKQVSQIYNSHEKTNNIQKAEQEQKLLKEYEEDLNHTVNSEHIISELKEFFYFKQNQFKPPIKSLIDGHKKSKQYFKKQDIKFFEVNEINRKYFQLQLLVKERFNSNNLKDCLVQIIQKNIEGQENKLVQTLFDQMQKEANGYSLCLTNDFLLNLLEVVTQTFQIYIQDKYSLEVNENWKKKIEEFVNNLKYNIQQNFKYQEQNSQDDKTQSYFFNQTIYKESELKIPASKFKLSDYITDIQNEPPHEQYELIKSEEQIAVKNKDNELSDFFKHLIDPTKFHLNPMDPIVTLAKVTFSEKICTDKILNDIQSAIFKNIFKSDDERKTILKELDGKIENLIILIRDSNDIEWPKKLSTISFQNTLGITQQILQITKNIDDDLKIFGMKVSESGLHCLHRIARVYLIRLMQEVRKLQEHSPIHIFEFSKNKQRDLFIAKMTSDDKKADKNLAKIIASQVADVLKSDEKKKVYQEEFRDVILFEMEKFEFKNIRDEIEKKLLQLQENKNVAFIELEKRWGIKDIKSCLEELKNHENIDKELIEKLKSLTQFNEITQNSQFELNAIDFIQLYYDPSNLLERIFVQKWNLVTNDTILKIQQKYQDKYQLIRLSVQDYLKQFLEKIGDKKLESLATQIFIPIEQQVQNENQRNEFQTNSKIALAQYFKKIMNRSQIEQVSNEYVFEIKGIQMKAKTLVEFRDIDGELDKDVLNKLTDFNEGISNLTFFITELKKQINFLLQPDKITLQKSDIFQNFQQDYRRKTLGCPNYCCLCARQCSSTHLPPKDLLHRCSSHQIQGLRGNQVSGFASVDCCNDFVNEDKVSLEGKVYFWDEFKKLIMERDGFNFDFDLTNAPKEREKSVRIWDYIGELMCKIHDIKFRRAENFNVSGPPVNTMYILLLDESGSMYHEWASLIIAAGQFASLVNQPGLKDISTIAIIKHESDTTIVGEQYKPSQAVEILKDLEFCGGGNDFGIAFKTTQEVIEKDNNKGFELYHIVFMTDGGDEYPDKEIIDIKNSQYFKEGKIKFTAIGYGSGADLECIQRISDELGGSVKEAMEPEELKTTFKMLAPNMYNTKK